MPGNTPRPNSSKSNSSTSSASTVNSQASNVQIKSIGIGGRRQAAIKKSKDGTEKTYTRTLTNGVKGPWVAAEKPPTTSTGMQLYLVRQEQKPGLRAHWSLVACDADNNNYKGTVWQVNGDPLTGMKYSEKPDKRVIGSRKFVDCTKLCQNVTAAVKTAVTTACKTTPEPNANADQKKVASVGDCQVWTCKVLDKLVAAKVTDAATVASIKTKQLDDKDMKAKNTFDQV